LCKPSIFFFAQSVFSRAASSSFWQISPSLKPFTIACSVLVGGTPRNSLFLTALPQAEQFIIFLSEDPPPQPTVDSLNKVI
jgi:hypothetical protein